MKQNFKFFLEQIWQEKITFTLKIIQIIVSFVILGFISINFYSDFNIHRQLNHLEKNKILYVLYDNNTAEYQDSLIMNPKNIPKFQHFVKKIISLKSELIVLNNEYNETIDGKSREILQVTPNFFENYRIKGDYNKKNVYKDYKIQFVDKNTETEHLAILGNGYRKKYKIGSVFTSSIGTKYKVVGFIQKNQTYIQPMQGKELNPLDYDIITPVYLDLHDNSNMYSFIFNAHFLVNNRSDLNELMKINNHQKLLNTYLKSYASQVKYVDQDYLNSTVLEGILGISLFLFSFAGMLCTMLQRIEDHAYEFAVNLMCGARMKDIYTRITLEFIIMIFLGVLISFFVFQVSIASLLIFLLATICYIIILIFTKIKINFDSLIENLKSKE